VLLGLTGYELRKPRPPAPKPAPKPKPEPKPEPTPAAPPEIKFPADYDEATRDVIRSVKPWTMTSPEKLNALVLAVRYVVTHQIPGDVVECGVWRGGSMLAAAKTLIENGDTGRDLHLYDTFEGMSEPTEHDKRHDGQSAADMLAASDKTAGVWAYASLEDVQATMAEAPYPAERIHYYKGKVEETIPGDAIPEQISILRLDTDWYESTRHEMEHLYPLLTDGGALIIDDYGHWEGARRAVDEYFASHAPPLLLNRIDYTGRIAIKH